MALPAEMRKYVHAAARRIQGRDGGAGGRASRSRRGLPEVCQPRLAAPAHRKGKAEPAASTTRPSPPIPTIAKRSGRCWPASWSRPQFLYRVEQAADASPVRTVAASRPLKPLTNWEMASRLSYFLWSSIPDDELRRAAAAGELNNPQGIQRQVKRMLADPKARRLSTEFFGQWLGFYHFDQYNGVDTSRFPEFTDEVKEAMYDEAVSFFEHIIRKDRPVREILFADYTFLNKPLAKFYGVKKEIKSTDAGGTGRGRERVPARRPAASGSGADGDSAPLRTSP